MKTKEEKRSQEIYHAANARYPLYGAIDPDNSDLNTGFVEGAEWSDRHPKNPWHVVKTEGFPAKDMLALVLMDSIYYVCDFKREEREWWVCDGYIAGYSPQGKPLYSSKTKLCAGDVERITRYMEIQNEPNEEDYE